MQFTIRLFLWLCLIGVLAGCDGLNVQTARQAEREQDGGPTPILLELDESMIRPPLNRDISDGDLPVPGALPPLPSAPDVLVIERELFAQIEARDGALASYTLAFSPIELDVLSRSGARQATSAIRRVAEHSQGSQAPSEPVDLSSELALLAQQGIRTSFR